MTNDYQQRLRKLKEGTARAYDPADVQQLTRAYPHSFRPTPLSNWWDNLPDHDKIWAVLEANWRWNPAIELPAHLVEQATEHLAPIRIRYIFRWPNRVWNALNEDQQIDLYRIWRAATDRGRVSIDWYSLMNEYGLEIEDIQPLILDFETPLLIDKLLSQWERDLAEAGKSSPFEVRVREHRFRVPDPRVKEVLPPMPQAVVQLHYPRPLDTLVGKPGWEMVQQWLSPDAIVALAEIVEEQPVLPPFSAPDFYEWVLPEVRDYWIDYWQTKVQEAQYANNQFLVRVFHVPGIPGNEKLNAVKENSRLAGAIKAWAGISDQKVRGVKTEEMGPILEDAEAFGSRFYASEEEEDDEWEEYR